MGKEKGYNLSHVYCQPKGWSKRVKQTFSMILERVFEMVWWRGENGITSKRIFEVEVLFSSRNIDFLFYSKRLFELLFFLPLFFSKLSLSLSMLCLFDDMGI
jgi:hypothetical protein